MNDPKKVSILNEILEEYNFEILNESIELSPKNFETFIRINYISPGQTVIGLDSLWEAIKKDPKQKELFEFIEEENHNKSLESEVDKMNDIEKTLFNLIKRTISITNGNNSELWFAIVYDGKVVGGKRNEETGDATTDVIVKGNTVSLKNYTTSVIDLGTLPNAGLLTQLIYLYKTITDIEPDPNLNSSTLNNILRSINNIEFEDELKKFLEIPDLKKNKIGLSFINKFQTNLEEAETTAEKFINQLNITVLKKVNKVNYWALIEDDTVYIKNSNKLIEKLKSTLESIASPIVSLKNNHINVSKNEFFKDKKPKETLEKVSISVPDIYQKGKSVSVDWYNNPDNKDFRKYFDKDKIKNNFISLKSNANIKLTEELTDYLVELIDPKDHFKQRTNERGKVLDILNLNEIPLKDYNVVEVKEKLKSNISNEIQDRATKILEKESIPSSFTYEVGIKILKPVLVVNGKEYSLKLFAKSTKVTKDGDVIEKDNIGTLYFATIYNNKAATLLLLNKEDDNELYSQIKKHAEGKPGREDKEAKILTPPNYIYRIDLDELMGKEKSGPKLTDPTSLDYIPKAAYKPKSKFTSKSRGEGTIVAASVSGQRAGEPDGNGIVDWIDVEFKFGKPKLKSGKLIDSDIVRFNTVLTTSYKDFVK